MTALDSYLDNAGKIFKFIGRFSSIDIFLISILIFIGKSVSTIDVSLSFGFYFLCAGTIMGLVKIEKFLKPYFSGSWYEERKSDKRKRME